MTYITWEESYTGRLRKAVGHDKLIIPSVRAIIQNEAGDILFIERRGENKWGMPAGSMELDESIYDCLKREVQEETGLIVEDAALVAVYSHPGRSMKNSFGDEYQMFELLFHVREWSGALVQETEESVKAAFFPQDRLPPGSDAFWDQHHLEVLLDFQRFAGQATLK